MQQTTQQITRLVTPIGNGAHIFLPKELINQEVLITIKPKPPIKQQILKLLEPHLENINGAYLYGSHARQEATQNSDIDLLVITEKPLKLKAPNIEILSIQEEKIAATSKNNPLIIPAILAEAKPIMNPQLLETLKKCYPINKKEIMNFIVHTKRLISINKKYLDRCQQNTFQEPESSAYSLILRLRGVFIANNLVSKKTNSNKKFKQWLKSKLPNTNTEQIYKAYQLIKNNQKPIKLNIQELYKTLELLKKEISKLGAKTNGKNKKANTKIN